MTTLSLNKNAPKPKSKWGIRDYIQRLSETRKKHFQSEIMTISLAYYLNADWRMVRNKIANRYNVGTLKDVGEYIRAIDHEIIQLVTEDYIRSYQTKTQ